MSAGSWQEVERVLAEILDLPDAERTLRLERLRAGRKGFGAPSKKTGRVQRSGVILLLNPVAVNGTGVLMAYTSSSDTAPMAGLQSETSLVQAVAER